jgi:hypothetical protein
VQPHAPELERDRPDELPRRRRQPFVQEPQAAAGHRRQHVEAQLVHEIRRQQRLDDARSVREKTTFSTSSSQAARARSRGAARASAATAGQ